MSTPKVLVLFPIYNGERTMRESLDCIANQDFTDFRAIIVDNKSIDGTAEIARAYCEKDPRFEVLTQEKHLSAVENFVFCMKYGRDHADYFCLRACDDFSSLNFLSGLVKALNDNPEKLLAAPTVRRVKGDEERVMRPDPIIFGYGKSLADGVVPRSLAYPSDWCYGLYRSKGGAEIMIRRWSEYPHAWCVASYVVAEFVMRDLAVWVEDAEFIFTEGSGSFEKYGAKTFLGKFRQRLNYTYGCYKVVNKLPQVSFGTRVRLFRRLWRDSRVKTRYDLEDHLLRSLRLRK
ncbi:glycosyltransferase family 2 protein [Roseibium aggregatum]|uniref:Glycosyltransferase family 2 protein n=1 Tax=Roseibium aggregatum TaxID=187304 RepID=A0A939EI32_9HYPH|nr:glycosyltransferase [Roseibium aggregatum]MBN9672668.1 glycosyltransferase family 2 protein [Roseibium aggregatum]